MSGAANPIFTSLRKLESQIRDRWELAGKDKDDFPSVAAKELENFRPEFGLGELVICFSELKEVPKQTFLRNEFGDHPMTILRNEDFSIDFLLWEPGRTTIHDHDFVGAFRCLSGRTHEIRYEFEVSETLDPTLDLGKMRVVGSAILSHDRANEIHSGQRTIHLAQHLDPLNINICVRTESSRVSPLSTYYFPSIRMECTNLGWRIERFLELISVLEKREEKQALAEVLRREFETLTLSQLLRIMIEKVDQYQFGSETNALVMSYARERIGDPAYLKILKGILGHREQSKSIHSQFNELRATQTRRPIHDSKIL